MWLLTGAEHPGFGFQAVENLWDCMIQAVENLWDCMIQVCVPCRICFVSNSLIQWNSNLSCFSRLTSLPRRLISRWLGLAQGTPWSAVVSHPCPPPAPSLKSRGRPVSTPHPMSQSSEPPGAGGGWAAHDAALSSPRGGFVGLAAEITRCPVPFEFQINDECLSRFCAVLGPTHADKCSLFI